jgi:TolA-binding protein
MNGGRRAGGRCALGLALLLLVTPSFAGQVDDLLSVGKKAFGDGHYSLAITSFQEILTDYPDSESVEEAEYLLGVSLFYAGKWTESLDALTMFRVQFAASSLAPRASYWMGAAYLKLENYQAALDSLIAATGDQGAANPYRLNAILLSGVALEGLSRDMDASAAYRKVLADAAAAPLAAEATYRLAGVELRAGRYGPARDLYGKVLIDSPRSPYVQDALFYLAECELSLGNLSEAEKRYRTLLSFYPDSSFRETAIYRLAEIAWRLKKGPAAIDQLDSLQMQYPHGALQGKALRLRADISLDEKRYDDAAAGFQAAADLLPDGIERQAALYSLGIAHTALFHAEAAADAFARARAGGSRDIAHRAGYQLALLLAHDGKVEEAAVALDAWLHAFPDGADTEQATRLLAELRDKQGDPRRALPHWDALVHGFPQSPAMPEYLFRRARALRAIDQVSAALDDYQRILKDFPDSAWRNESSYSIGLVYTERGEFPRALPFFQSVARDSASGEAGERSRLSAALCQFNMGSFSAALASLQAFRGSKPATIPEGTIVLYMGRALYRMERLDDASGRLREAAALLADPASPQGADALYWLGWSHLRRGRIVEARDAFIDLARIYPGDTRRAEALFRAAVAETMRSDDAAGIGLFDKVLAMPRQAANDDIREQALYERAWALLRTGRTNDCADALEKLAREFPAGRLAPHAFFTMAEKSLDAGRYQEAQAGFLRVSRNFPRSDLALQSIYWGAESLRREGKWEAAADGFWECLAAGARSGLLTSALDGFAASLRAADSLDLARGYAGQALTAPGLTPEGSAGVRLAAADLLLPTQPDNALTLIIDVRRNSPPEPYAGQASLLLGKYYSAVRDWNRSLDTLGALESSRADEIGAQATLERGRTLEAMGRTSDAIDEFVKVGYLFHDYAELAAEGLYDALRLARARGDKDRAARIEQSLRATYPESRWIRMLDAKKTEGAAPPPSVNRFYLN